jgi:hypothetical protein
MYFAVRIRERTHRTLKINAQSAEGITKKRSRSVIMKLVASGLMKPAMEPNQHAPR